MSADRLDADDPLRELTAAFAALPAPPTTRELDAEDEATQRAVAWMRDALAAQRPARDGLRELHARRAEALGPPAFRPAAWRPLAAAALLLVLLGGPAWLALRHGRAPADLGAGTAPPLAVAPRAPDTSPRAEAPRSAGLVAVNDRTLELRSGSVRLLLVLDKPPSKEESR
jgi:hypothetical protein